MIVVVEGMDFTGKTTVCAQVAALLTAQGLQVRCSYRRQAAGARSIWVVRSVGMVRAR